MKGFEVMLRRLKDKGTFAWLYNDCQTEQGLRSKQRIFRGFYTYRDGSVDSVKIGSNIFIAKFFKKSGLLLKQREIIWFNKTENRQSTVG